MEDTLNKLREEYKTASPYKRKALEITAKELKKKVEVKEHKHKPSPFKSGIEGSFFIFNCFCGEEIVRDFMYDPKNI